MAGRGQIPDGREADYGLPTGPGTGLSQQQFGDRFPGQDAFNLGQGHGFNEGQTIPQNSPAQVPGDDWNPYAVYLDAIRYGGGRNSVFGSNSIEQAPETRMADPNLYNIADQEIRDYTPFEPRKTDSLGPTQQTPWDSGEQTPQNRVDDNFFNYIPPQQQPQQQQPQQEAPWWQQYVSPYGDQYYTSQMPQGRGANTTFSDRFSNMPPNVELPPIGENDPSLIYNTLPRGRTDSLGPTQQTPWDSPQQPGGDTNQTQDYQGDVPQPQQPPPSGPTRTVFDPDDPFRTAPPPERNPTVDVPTRGGGGGQIPGGGGGFTPQPTPTVPNRIGSFPGFIGTGGFDAAPFNPTGLPNTDIHGAFSTADNDRDPANRRGNESQLHRDQVAAILAARGYV